ncbi:MAG TPA: AMP-binding protein, partial [Jiangellaceae bacterium]|nr:AMP-binding protein [Jiangellaceae bacterium]
MTSEALSNLLHEERRFPPSDDFVAQANAGRSLYDEAGGDVVAFWERQARDLVSWDSEWTQGLDWSNRPFAKWFVGGSLNISYNCVDRHVEAGHGEQVAFHWEGEPGDTRTVTYADLKREVCRAANALTELGVRKGDRVAIYMPMIPEMAIAMLACARIGAPHSVVFGGFSADALKGRIQDADARLVITADGGYRRGSASPLKPAVDRALTECPDVRTVLVVRRTGQHVDWTDGRDV